jgi:methylase of polypeptide subunit release factors
VLAVALRKLGCCSVNPHDIVPEADGLGLPAPSALTLDGAWGILAPGATLWSGVARHSPWGASGTTSFGEPPYEIAIPAEYDVPLPSSAGQVVMHALDRALPVLAERLRGRPAIDIGCGSGNLTLPLLRAGASSVVALDTNPHSPAVTRHNALLNGTDPRRVAAETTPFLEWRPKAPGERYVIAITNPPQLPLPPDFQRGPVDGSEMALFGGPKGRDLLDASLDRAGGLLTEDGVLIVGHSSFSDIGSTIEKMSGRGYEMRVLGSYIRDAHLGPVAAELPALTPYLEALREQGACLFRGTRGLTCVLAFSKTPTNDAFHRLGWPATPWIAEAQQSGFIRRWPSA